MGEGDCDGSYGRTVVACFAGYVTQAIVNNFAPLLFVCLASEFNISLAEISALIAVNFVTQLIVDLAAGKFVDRVGYKRSILFAQISAALGLLVLGFVVPRAPNPYVLLMGSIVLCAIGGGLIEVMVSPIVEACPNPRRAQTMSLLHSFYCWGQFACVVLSTLYFAVVGINCWPTLACLWAIVPATVALLFVGAPIPAIVPDGLRPMGIHELMRSPNFATLLIMMLCAGAAEQGMSQWASAFAEMGLGVSKAFGDLAGPAAFALMMGLARTFYGAVGSRLRLGVGHLIAVNSGICFCAYLIAACAPQPVVALLGCALAGFSVGIMWPGTFSLSAELLPAGGTLMYALLATAGDVGCAAGPMIVGLVADVTGGEFRLALLAGSLFALVMPCCAAWVSSHVAR